MSATLVRQKVKDGERRRGRSSGARPIRDARSHAPEGVHYASTRVVDSATFVIVTELAGGIEDPGRPSPSSSGSWSSSGAGWTEPVIEHLDVEVHRRLEIVGRMPT
jgi:hypothetical protein